MYSMTWRGKCSANVWAGPTKQTWPVWMWDYSTFDSMLILWKFHLVLFSMNGWLMKNLIPEVEFLRTSLASRTHFEVLVLGLKSQVLGLASKPQVLENCLVLSLRTTLFFWTTKILLENARNLAENLRRPFLCSSVGDRLKNLFEDVFIFFFFANRLKKIFGNLFLDRQKKFWRPFFWRTFLPVFLTSSIPVLSLDGVCPRKGCIGLRFFYVLGLDPGVFDSTFA